eukprot:2271446-Rhodomonas_salina.1
MKTLHPDWGLDEDLGRVVAVCSVTELFAPRILLRCPLLLATSSLHSRQNLVLAFKHQACFQNAI